MSHQPVDSWAACELHTKHSMVPGIPVPGVEERYWGQVVIHGMLVYWAGYELLGCTSQFHRFIHSYFHLSLFQFESTNKRINYILTREHKIYLHPIYYSHGRKGVLWSVTWLTLFVVVLSRLISKKGVIQVSRLSWRATGYIPRPSAWTR